MANIVWRDILTMTLVLMVTLFAWLLTQIAQQSHASSVDIPGNIMASILWPSGDVDVDLWVDGPGEPVPVGFSNKGGVLWNLLRDDLGSMPDYTPLNYENAFTRGIPPGKYRINVQCYRCAVLPVVVQIEVSKRASSENSITLIGSSTITLRSDHEEKTALAFEIDAAGNVVPGSMNTLFKPLRHGGK